MKTALLYGTVAIASFIAFAIAFAPASLVWNAVKNDVAAAVPDLQVLTVDGSIWQGEANLRYREFPPATLEWGLSPTALAGMSVALEARLSGNGLRASGHGHATRSSTAIDAKGTIEARYINPVSTRYGLTFPGEIRIEGLALDSDLSWFTAASGRATWNGGRVVLNMPEGARTLILPPLAGEMTMEDTDLRLDVTNQRNGNLLLVVRLKPTGWAVVDMKARLLEISGLSYRAGTNPNASAFIIEEKLF
ncbi:MAG: type II secretion system protein N [Gammaproteobacteria bacterium]|nr:type II secretion system protein N [Gammaproteobacteria bacterium]